VDASRRLRRDGYAAEKRCRRFRGNKKQKVFSESLFQTDKGLYARRRGMLSDFRQTLRAGAELKNALLIKTKRFGLNRLICVLK
jgi:hypothetical protein